MGIIEFFEDRKYYRNRSKASKAELDDLIAKLKSDADEMLMDDRVNRLLAEVEEAVSQGRVSLITLENKGKFNQYTDALFIHYVQPEAVQNSTKWSKPAERETIPPVRIDFADYDLYFAKEDACAFLYIIFCTYHTFGGYSTGVPKYGEDYNGKPPFRWTFDTMEDAAAYYVSSHYTGDKEDSISDIIDIMGSICFPV